MNKQMFTAGLGLLLSGCLVGAPLAAHASSISMSATQSVVDGSSLSWRQIDWQAIADQARANGDDQGALDSIEVRDYASTVANGSPQSRQIVVSLLKKAIIQVAKHNISRMPVKIRPYANKIINVVEKIESFQEAPLVAALSHAGIPYDVAVATAQWIVFFVGL